MHINYGIIRININICNIKSTKLSLLSLCVCVCVYIYIYIYSGYTRTSVSISYDLNKCGLDTQSEVYDFKRCSVLHWWVLIGDKLAGAWI